LQRTQNEILNKIGTYRKTSSPPPDSTKQAWFQRFNNALFTSSGKEAACSNASLGALFTNWEVALASAFSDACERFRICVFYYSFDNCSQSTKTFSYVLILSLNDPTLISPWCIIKIRSATAGMGGQATPRQQLICKFLQGCSACDDCWPPLRKNRCTVILFSFTVHRRFTHISLTVSRQHNQKPYVRLNAFDGSGRDDHA
jgi:hypothetical protein